METEKTAAELAAAAATETPPPDTRTPEQKEQDSAYQRTKFMHGAGFGPDPDKAVVHLPDGTDDRGKTKFKAFDFRKDEEAEAAAKTAANTKAKEEADGKAKTEADAAAKTKAKAKPAKAAAAPAKKTSAERDEELERVAAAAAAETAKRMSKGPAAAPEKEGFTLPPKEQRMLEIFHEMEKNDPSQKGLAGRHINFWKQAAKYAESWQKDNPGKVYNPNDDEHTAFYAEHEPAFDQDAYDETRDELRIRPRVQKALAEAEAKTNSTVRTLEVKGRMRDEHGQVVEVAQGSKVALMQAVIPDILKGIAGEGEFQITNETVDKLEAQDPIAFRVLSETADELGLQVFELERLSRYPEAYPFDPKLATELLSTLKTNEKGQAIPGTGRKFYPHKALHAFAEELESAMAADPDSDRDGRAFLTQAAWQERAQKIFQSDQTAPEKQAALATLGQRYWRLQPEDIRKGLIAAATAKAREKIAELNDLVGLKAKNGISQKSEAGAAAAGETAGAKTAAAAAVAGVVKDKAKPPASASVSDRSDTHAAKPMTEDERLDQVSQAAF